MRTSEGKLSTEMTAAAGAAEKPRSSWQHSLQRQSQPNYDRSSAGAEPKKSSHKFSDESKKKGRIDFHKVPLEQLLLRLDTHPTRGLSEEEAAARLRIYGRNEPTPPPATPLWLRLARCMTNLFALLLWLAALLCIVAYAVDAATNFEYAQTEHLTLGIVLAFANTLAGCFACYQETKSAAIMDSFKKLSPQRARVIRDGVERGVPAAELVVGDIVRVTAGDRMPADVRVCASCNFRVDNASLTGSSHPQSRCVDWTSENPLETCNLAFCFTDVLEGEATCVVTFTGDGTVMGRIGQHGSGALDDPGSVETPIAKEINDFVHIITVVSVIIGAAFFIVPMVYKYTWIESVLFLIGIIVANVPEGLLVTVTVCLTLAAHQMAVKNCLVKNFEVVETLGSTTVICADKTGALTQNRMTVSHLWQSGAIHELDTAEKNGTESNAPESTGVTDASLLRCALLCNRAKFEAGQDDLPASQRQVNGDATEAGLLRFCALNLPPGVPSVDAGRLRWPKLAEVLFNSQSRFQASVHRPPSGDADARHLCVMKGAPEVILDRCSTVLVNGEEQRLSLKWRRAVAEACARLGGLGERVLAFGDLRLPSGDFPDSFRYDSDGANLPLSGYRLVGMMSLIDPPRDAVPYAVHKCKTAGIRVVMITGDHPITAAAIARNVGIISPDSHTPESLAQELGIPVCFVDPADAAARVIHGDQLENMTSEQLADVLRRHREIVFARTSPQQKLTIVEAFQSLGHVVAVTGCGVNDSPALKRADIGIAMGVAGCDVSREAADMILLDDNFASIVIGIEEGRLIFDNLKKSIAYTLTSKVAEMTPFIVLIGLGIPLALGTVHILCIDLGTDLLPAISLAYEAPESDLMRRPPRDPDRDRLVNRRLIGMAYGQIGVLQAAAGWLVYFSVMAHSGFLPGALLFRRLEWNSKVVDSLLDSYGQEWTYEERKRLEMTCQTAFFVAIVIVQWSDLIICKTRRLSVFQQGMRNHPLTFSLFFESLLAMLLSYMPYAFLVLKMMPLKIVWCLLPLGHACLIFIFDEARKALLRNLRAGNFVEWATYY